MIVCSVLAVYLQLWIFVDFVQPQDYVFFMNNWTTVKMAATHPKVSGTEWLGVLCLFSNTAPVSSLSSFCTKPKAMVLSTTPSTASRTSPNFSNNSNDYGPMPMLLWLCRKQEDGDATTAAAASGVVEKIARAESSMMESTGTQFPHHQKKWKHHSLPIIPKVSVVDWWIKTPTASGAQPAMMPHRSPHIKKGSKGLSQGVGDPYLGKQVTFQCLSGDTGGILNDLLASQIPAEPKWCELDNDGHMIVGIVQKLIAGSKGRGSSRVQYDVCWEFSGPGITAVDVEFLLDGMREADRLSWKQEEHVQEQSHASST